MNLLRRLIPPFLQQLDLWLQENHPRLWATRIHLHLWFIALLDVLAFGLGLLIPVSAHRHPEPEEVWGYMMVPTVVYACFWVYRVLLFTVERRFGKRHLYAEVGELLLHWVSLLLILTLPMTLSLTLAWRIGHLVSDDRLQQDVATLNNVAPWLYGTDTYEADEEVGDRTAATSMAMAEMDATMAEAQARMERREPQGHGTHHFHRSTAEYLDRYRARMSMEVETERDLHEIYEDHVRAYNFTADPSDTDGYDPDTAAYHLHVIDSIEAHCPLLCQDVTPFTPYHRWKGSAFATDSALERQYVERFDHHDLPDATTIEAALAAGRWYAPNVRAVSGAQVLKEFSERAGSTTSIWSAESPIERIAEAKAWDYEFLEWAAIFYGMVLPCFVIALLLSVFKNLYWQPFLIAVVTAGVLPILILVFALLTEHTVFHARDEVIMQWSYYLVVLFLMLMSLRVPLLKAYRTRPAVMAVLANAATPFFGLFTLWMLHDRFDIFGQDALQALISAIEYQYPNDPRLMPLREQLAELDQHIAWMMQAFLWGGIIVYTFALHPLFRWCWTRLMALPERK